MEYVVRVECFEAYGLNNYRNFLKEDYLRFYSEEELLEHCEYLIEISDCERPAVFVHSFNGNMSVVIPNDEEGIDLMSCSVTDMDFFKAVDGDMRFCCYALLIEVRPGLFKVIEE